MRVIGGREFERFRVLFVREGALEQAEVEAEDEFAAQRAVRARVAGADVLEARQVAPFGFYAREVAA